MQTILAISSYVAHGTVGLQATVPPLQMAGRNVIAIPTIVLSNHPGHKTFAGDQVSATRVTTMIEAIKANGWLSDVSAVFSGYLPTSDHVAAVRDAVRELRDENPNLIYVCDPILGDDPGGLYIGAPAADAIRSQLIPLASVVTPNRFELSWLTGQSIDDVGSAIAAARSLGVQRVAITSVPAPNGQISNLFITPSGTWISSVEKREKVPHGTGDLFSGVLLSAMTRGVPDNAVLGFAAGAVAHAINLSDGRDKLDLANMRWSADCIIPAATTALPA